MAFRSWKAWWRRRQLRRHGIVADPRYQPVPVGGGAEWDGWQVVAQGLNRDAIVYSFGLGNDIDFDLEMIRCFGATVHGFDPTAEAIAYLRQQTLPPQFHLHPRGLAAHDGTLSLYPPRKPGRVNYSQERLEYVTDQHPPVQVPVARLATIMRELGHTHIDVLKIDIEGSEFEAVPELLRSGCSIGQLLVEVHYHYPTRSFEDGLQLFAAIQAAGMRCFHISPRAYEFGFIADSAAASPTSAAAQRRGRAVAA